MTQTIPRKSPKLLACFATARAARQPFAATRHAQKRPRFNSQSSSGVAVRAVPAAKERHVNGVERPDASSEGWRSNGDAVLRNSSEADNRREAGNQEETRQWHRTGFPTYMQSEKDDFCQSWDESVQDRERRDPIRRGHGMRSAVSASNPVWQAMRKEASKDAKDEPLLSSFMYASILSHSSFSECLASVLANRLSDPTMLATEYFETFLTVFNENPEIVQAALDDIQAVCERDPACNFYSHALLFYKGYQAIQVHRIAHHLWNLDQRISARNLQYRVSQVFAMDIHPQAKFGKGILMDHGTGIVVGQTAVIGNNVSMLQNVTLGGTGKTEGDRHPKISDNVLIGAGATILGNIVVGKGAMVASGSMVLKAVPSKTMVAGSPAREVGKLSGNPALKMQHWLKASNTGSDPVCEPFEGMIRSKAAEQPGTASAPLSQKSEDLEGRTAPSAADPSDAASLTEDTSQSPPNSGNGASRDRSHQGVSDSVHGSSRAANGSARDEDELPKASSTSQRSPNGRPTGYFHTSTLPLKPRQHESSRDAGSNGQTARKDASNSSEQPGKNAAQEEEAVIGVRSDVRAHKLWPNGPEPEYYL